MWSSSQQSFLIPPPTTLLNPNFRRSNSRKTNFVYCSCSQPQHDDQQQQQTPLSSGIKWLQPPPDRSCGGSNRDPPYQIQRQSPLDQVRKVSNDNKLGKLAMIAVAAGVLTLGSVHDASAAKTGGRVGGQAFRSSAPRNPSPRINNNNSRTNIYINPRVAPPLGGGYGYGVPYYGGGYGWSPFSFFAPGPSVAVGIGGGFDTILLFMLLGAGAAVVRRFFGSRNVDDDDDDY